MPTSAPSRSPALALVALVRCGAPEGQERIAFVCASQDGRDFRAVSTAPHDSATYWPLGEATISVREMEGTSPTFMIRDGNTEVVIDRAANAAVVRSSEPAGAGTFTCAPDPSGRSRETG